MEMSMLWLRCRTNIPILHLLSAEVSTYCVISTYAIRLSLCHSNIDNVEVDLSLDVFWDHCTTGSLLPQILGEIEQLHLCTYCTVYIAKWSGIISEAQWAFSLMHKHLFMQELSGPLRKSHDVCFLGRCLIRRWITFLTFCFVLLPQRWWVAAFCWGLFLPLNN